MQRKCEAYKFNHRVHWFRLALARRDWPAALQHANQFPKDKITASYLRALVYLKKGDFERARPEVHVLQGAYQTNRAKKELEQRLWLVQGLLLCSTGSADSGLQMLQKLVQRTKDDYGLHSWGHGAYFMEYWGLAALRANRLAVAEEAFLEALAHDARSVRGALGMFVVCDRQGRNEEAQRFAELAQRCWRNADSGAIEAELDYFRSQGSAKPTTSVETKGTR